MSMPYVEPTEPTSTLPHESGDDPGTEPAQQAQAVPQEPRSGWTLVALIPHDGKEPPANLADDAAVGTWCAVSALWHPSLLARAAELPRIEPIESPSTPGPREIRVVAFGAIDRLPSGYRTQAEDAGAVVLESGADRAGLIRRIQEELGAVGTPETAEDEAMLATSLDFLALGTCRWLIRDLAIAMGHADAINHESLSREVLSGADAWQIGDRPTAVNRLRAGFEILTQARERFYPVDAYILDLCLLDPAMPSGVLADPLESHVPVTFVAPARAIENQARHDPERLAALRQAITEGRMDVVGGTYAEAEDVLLPLESILWQFRRGGEVYRAHLEERNVETYARRRFGLYAQVPQLAKRHGFRFAVHVGLDAGRFPIRAESKRLWESPDGSSLETLTRPPMAADRPSQGAFVPWRLAATMKNDHVATLPLVHWPQPVSAWYLDLRRSAGYSPVLARWTTLNDYFHLTDRPYEGFRPEPDAYVTPYLSQSVSRGESQPISRLARQHRLRARFEALETVRASALSIAAAESSALPVVPDVPADQPAPAALECLIETGERAEAASALDRLEVFWAGELARKIIAAGNGAPAVSRPGYLVINPVGVSRRATVLLPDAALDLRPEGPLRAAQFTDEGVHAVVDLPAFGFAWVPKEANVDLPPVQPGGLAASGRTLRNEMMQIEIDGKTGGIRGLMTVDESTPRLGQQLVMTGLGDDGGKAVITQMRGERFELDYAGPALAQATASGSLIDPRNGRRLAGFEQRYRLWTGRPILEIEVQITDLDEAWLEQARGADPWSRYLACRWAWPDPTSMLRRTVLLAPEMTEAARPETPGVLDISTRRQRTGLVFGGLPYHQMNGGRMLDTLLVAGGETERCFRLGVVLDLEYPFQASEDFLSPALVVPTDEGPPALGSRGWLILVDHKAVAVTHVGFVESSGEGRGWGLVIHVLETSGQAARCRLRLFRNPTWARQIDFLGESVIDLSIDGDAVLLDLTPNELARVEVTLG